MGWLVDSNLLLSVLYTGFDSEYADLLGYLSFTQRPLNDRKIGPSDDGFVFLVCNNIRYSGEIHEISSSPEKWQNVDSEKVKLTSVQDFLESGALYSLQKSK